MDMDAQEVIRGGAESDVNRFDHTIGGIQFGTLREQAAAVVEDRVPEPDAEAES